MVTLIDKREGGPVRHPEKANRPDTPVQRKPAWIRVKAPGSAGYAGTARIVRENSLHTVCEEASCPNIGECWEKRHATMMIMGDTCTRACAFCNVKTGMPGSLDEAEPQHVAEAVAALGLEHVVVTSVDRDDLADGGAAHFAATIRAIRAAAPATTIEVLTPDFPRQRPARNRDRGEARRVQPQSRNRALALSHRQAGCALFPLAAALAARQGAGPGVFTKSGIMLGLGETRNEVLQLMDDLRSADVDFLTIGQYLQPTRKHAAVDRFAAGRVRELQEHRLRQGLPHGGRKPADALVLPRRRRFPAPEGSPISPASVMKPPAEFAF